MPSTADRLALPRWLPLLLVFLLAALMRHGAIANDDVSWGLTMADKVLDGQRLYVDVIEVNPPATVFLYIVPALLERLSGLPGEFFVDLLVFAAAALSLGLSRWILRRADLALVDGWVLTTVAATVLLIVPALRIFGEREHVAVIVFLPLLSAAWVRATGGKPSHAMTIVAGVCGGIVAIIKPHFAVPIIGVATVAALHVRSWRPLFALENWIAAGLLAIYAATVVIVYPAFIADVVPMVLATYVPVRVPWQWILVDFATPIWAAALLLTAVLEGRGALKPPYSLLLAASVGFSVAFFVQGKAWPYQSYPMLALALMALALAVIERWRRVETIPARGRIKRLASALCTGLLVGATMFWLNVQVDPTALVAAVSSVKPRPKIIALSPYLWAGFPLTRMVGGTWVGRVSSLWISSGADYRRQHETLDPRTGARLDGYIARDKAMFAEDLARQRPDVIVLTHGKDEPDWLAWANSDPPLAAQMKHYHLYRSIPHFDVLRRDADP